MSNQREIKIWNTTTLNIYHIHTNIFNRLHIVCMFSSHQHWTFWDLATIKKNPMDI